MGMNDMAGRLIPRFAKPVVFLRHGVPVSDGAGGNTPGSVTEYSATGAVLQYDAEALAQADSFIQLNDMRALILVEALPIQPRIGDKLRVGASIFKIVRVSSFGTDAMPSFYDLQVRSI